MTTKKLTFIALISCISYLTMVVFKIPVYFLSYEIKDVIITIGAIYLGIKYGILISFIVALIEMITISDSGIIGFLMNFLSTIFYVTPIVYFYNKKALLKGIIIGTICMSLVMFVFNIFITPLYLKIELKETVKLLFTLITPFNIIKGSLNGILIFIISKPLLKAIQKSNI